MVSLALCGKEGAQRRAMRGGRTAPGRRMAAMGRLRPILHRAEMAAVGGDLPFRIYPAREALVS
jgi:hypothetical protein